MSNSDKQAAPNLGDVNRLIRSLEEAVGFARGDCDHEWVRLRKTIMGGVVCECPKCKVRVTTYENHGE